MLGITILVWLMWQLRQAKKFTKFKHYVDTELRTTVLQHIKSELSENSCELYPNTQAHIDATLYYWGKYKIRILQAALEKEIITMNWLKQSGNYRNCQHLFHIEQAYKASAPVERITIDEKSTFSSYE